MKCPYCGASLQNTAKFCADCGQRIEMVTEDRINSSHKTSGTSVLNANSRRGKYQSPSSKKSPQRKSHKGAGRIMLLILIAVLICAFALVVRPLIGIRKNEENRQSSAAQVQNTNGNNTSHANSFFANASKKTQTIYVMDGKSIKSQNDDYATIYTYEYNEDGFPLQRHLGYSDSRWDSFSTFYAYDFSGVTEEMVKFSLESSNLNGTELEKKEEKYSSKLNEILEAYSINPDCSSYEVLGIKDEFITATTSGAFQTIVKYNLQGKKIEEITYNDGEAVAKTSISYLANNKRHLVETYNNITDMYYDYYGTEYTYDSGDDIVSVKFTQTQKIKILQQPITNITMIEMGCC